ALQSRDRGCRFPGCTNRRFVDGHHIVHWIDGGETSLGNTVLLCRRHHRYVHECGFSMERNGEELVFRDRCGTVIPPQAERPAVAADLARFMGGWLDDPVTASPPGWDGQPVDYDLCISALR
ncbi:MAG TPA: HNH endonuclease signature motif containing protein, partial [Kofleriaceae bacterium]